MTELDLEPEIWISTLRGEDPADHVATLDRVLTVTKARMKYLVDSDENCWSSPGTTVVVAPSSEVLANHDVLNHVQVICRMGRSCGISLRLLDATPLLFNGEPSLLAVGSGLVRLFATDPSLKHVTFHQLSPIELMDLVEVDA